MKSIRGRFQVLLKEYHSPSSNVISDRLIESIHFGDNYQTIVALDTKDQLVKARPHWLASSEAHAL